MNSETNMLQLARSAYTQAPDQRPALTARVRQRLADGTYESPAHREQLATLLLLLFRGEEEVPSGCL